MNKRFRSSLSLFLAILLVISCAAAAVANALQLGDVDGSGKVNSSDARLALRAAARMETLTDEQFAAADADGNGKVNSSDARRILRAAAKIEALPTETQPTVPGQHYAWVRIGTEVRERPAEETYSDINTFSASEYSHACSMTHISDGGGRISASYASACSAMPAVIEAHERFTVELTLALTDYSENDGGTYFTVQARLRSDEAGLGFGQRTEDKVYYPAVNEGAYNHCIIDSPCVRDDAPNNVGYVKVYGVYKEGYVGQRFGVYYEACGSETVWTYEWQAIGAEQTETEPYITAPPATEPSVTDAPSTDAPTTEFPTAEFPTSPSVPLIDGDMELFRTPVTGEDLEALQSDDYTILFADNFTTDRGEHGVFDHYVTIEYDIPSYIPENERENYFGMYFADDGVHWMMLDPEGLAEGKFRFETLHLSPWGIGEPSEIERMDRWAARAAAQGVTRRISEDEITPGLKDMINDAMEAGGMGASQYGGAIVRYLLSHDSKGELLTAVADGDMESVKKLVANGTAEYLVGKVLSGEDDGVLYSGGVDNAELLKKRVKEGDPSATLEIVKNIEKNMFPAVSYAEKFAGVVDKLADIWTDNMVEEQYALYEKIRNRDGGVNSDDWALICTQLRGALNRLSSRGVTASDLKRKFEQRFDNTAEINAKHKEILRLMARWSADNLFDSVYWKGYPSTVEKLNSLLAIREMVRDMLTKDGKFQRGKEYQNLTDEYFLNDATAYWVRCSIHNRNDFYDWLREQGILPPLPAEETTVPPTTEPDTEEYTGNNPFHPGLTIIVTEYGDPGETPSIAVPTGDSGLETWDIPHN
ncbi:MAG: dockerin type I repeat-containing protein [Clostridia bacterium]|nr:dockerin type I repeat-containing protein [Clostridia bacterium]